MNLGTYLRLRYLQYRVLAVTGRVTVTFTGSLSTFTGCFLVQPYALRAPGGSKIKWECLVPRPRGAKKRGCRVPRR